VLRYTKPWRLLSRSAAQTDDWTEVVATAEEKARIFMAQAFLTQTGVDGQTSLPDSMVSVSARDVREALFIWLVEQTPEADSIGFRALAML
jgi:hypothetical protein